MSGVPAVELFWGYLLDHVGPLRLKTLGTFFVHELFYWTAHLPFLVADAVPSLRRWKIQQDKPNTRTAVLLCLRRVLLTHILLVLPIILATHPLLDLLGMHHSVASLPTLPHMAVQIFVFFLIEDFVFYWGHRALHTPFLYKTVHHVHHHHAAPFGIAAEYAHPCEVLFLGTATIAGPLIIPPHLLTLLVYLALRCLQTVECHSGYHFPCSLARWFPLYGGAYFHDHHHRIHSGNYSSTFVWVDALFRTDTAFHLWRRKQLQPTK